MGAERRCAEELHRRQLGTGRCKRADRARRILLARRSLGAWSPNPGQRRAAHSRRFRMVRIIGSDADIPRPGCERTLQRCADVRETHEAAILDSLTTKEAFKRAFLDKLFFVQGKFPALATRSDYYMALAYTVRDRIMQRWVSTATTYTQEGSRTVSYLSAEFLMGPHLGNNLLNLGIYAEVEDAIAELGLNLDDLLAQE